MWQTNESSLWTYLQPGSQPAASIFSASIIQYELQYYNFLPLHNATVVKATLKE